MDFAKITPEVTGILKKVLNYKEPWFQDIDHEKNTLKIGYLAKYLKPASIEKSMSKNESNPAKDENIAANLEFNPPQIIKEEEGSIKDSSSSQVKKYQFEIDESMINSEYPSDGVDHPLFNRADTLSANSNEAQINKMKSARESVQRMMRGIEEKSLLPSTDVELLRNIEYLANKIVNDITPERLGDIINQLKTQNSRASKQLDKITNFNPKEPALTVHMQLNKVLEIVKNKLNYPDLMRSPEVRNVLIRLDAESKNLSSSSMKQVRKEAQTLIRQLRKNPNSSQDMIGNLNNRTDNIGKQLASIMKSGSGGMFTSPEPEEKFRNKLIVVSNALALMLDDVWSGV